MKEIIIFAIIAVCSLVILGFTVHMFIGGLVSESTELWSIIAAVSIGLIVLTILGIDIIKQRRKQ